MAISLNKVTLIGHVGNLPEIRSTSEGKEIANFSLATSESWKDKISGEKKEKTEWHKIVVFSEGLVSIVKNYVKKGSKIYIEGSLHTRKWVDNNNIEKYTTEIILQNYNSNMILLDNKSENTNITNSSIQKNDIEKKPKDNNVNYSDLDDEIPF
jgi:single-strand DNA-binding protein